MHVLQLQFLLMTLAGWVNRSQQDVIEYLQEENRVLREHLGGRRLHFTDAQRSRLATQARKLSRRALIGSDPIVTRIPCSAGTGPWLPGNAMEAGLARQDARGPRRTWSG